MAKPKGTAEYPVAPASAVPAAPLPPTLAERVALAVEAERNSEWERIEAKIDEVFGPGLDKERRENGLGELRVSCEGWLFSLTGPGYHPVHLQVFACVLDYAGSPLCWRELRHSSELARLSPVRAYPAAAAVPPRELSPILNPIAYWGDVFYRWANGYK